MKIRLCPRCGKHNSENAWHCTNCRETLSVNTIIELDTTLVDPEVPGESSIQHSRRKEIATSELDSESEFTESNEVARTVGVSEMDEYLIEETRIAMEYKSTEELLEIWREDGEDRRDETFEAIRRVLIARGLSLPAHRLRPIKTMPDRLEKERESWLSLWLVALMGFALLEVLLLVFGGGFDTSSVILGIGNFILVAALWNWRKTMTRKGKVTIGALTGVLVALLVAIIMSRQFTSLAAEANAIIIEKYSGKSYSIFEVSADLQGLHRRIAQEGGWRGFLAQRILANGGLGFPEVNKPKDRVWFWTCAVGALIAVTGAATQKWWAILATIVAVVWGMPILFTGPVALTIILCSGIVGGMVGGAVAILLPEET